MAFSRPSLLIATLCAAPSCWAALTVGQPFLETRSYLGGPAIGPCDGPVLSASARFLSFTCDSAGIVPDDTNDRSDGFLLDRITGEIQRTSIDSLGGEHRFASGGGIPSDDGRRVVFNSYAKLDPSIPWDYWELGILNIFLRDLEQDTTVLIGKDSLGQSPQTGTSLGAVLHERNEVVIASVSHLMGDDENGPWIGDLYVRNWQSGMVELISVSPLGEQSDCFTERSAAISGNGRYVVFVSCASNLTDDNPFSIRNLFVRDRWLGTTRRLTWPWLGGEFVVQPNFTIDFGSRVLTGDRYLAFSAISAELAAGAGAIQPNSYLLDIVTGEIELISSAWDGSPNPLGGERLSVSGDGRFVAFSSRSPLITPDPGPIPAAYLKDRRTGEIVNISALFDGQPTTDRPVVNLSADGSTLALTWRHGDDEPEPYRGRTLIYTVSISGTPIELPEPEPVPSASILARWLASVALLMAGLASLNLRHRRAH